MQVKKAVMLALIDFCTVHPYDITYGDAEKLAELVESKLQSANAEQQTKGENNPCSRKGDCAHERVTGECLGIGCGVYNPA